MTSTTQMTSGMFFEVANDIALIAIFLLGFYLFSSRKTKTETKSPCWMQEEDVEEKNEEVIVIVDESATEAAKAAEEAAAQAAARVAKVLAEKEAYEKVHAQTKAAAQALAQKEAAEKVAAEQAAMEEAFAEKTFNQGKVEAELEVISQLGAVRSASDLRHCFQYACENGVESWSGDVVEALLEAASRVRNQPLLQQIVEVARRVGIPTARAYGSLLRASDSLPAARAVWDELVCSGLNVSEAEYVIMIAACSAYGADDEAQRILATAKTNLGSVSMAVYVPMLKALCARKEAEKALALFTELRRMLAASQTQLPLMIFNLMIDACSRAGRMEDAQDLFDSAMELNLETDISSYASLVKGYCVSAQLENALTLFAQLRRRQLKADVVLYHSLLDACAKRHMPMLADQILADMATDGHSANNMTLCILVKLYGRDSWGRALQVFNQLPSKHGFEPNAAAYVCLISAALQRREIAGAINTKERMVRAGCTADEKVYQTLLNGCLRSNDLDAAVGVAEEAVNLKLCSTKSLDDVLFMSERRGRSDLAARVRFLRKQ